MLRDDALYKVCADFKIGVYIYKSFLHIPDIWELHLAAGGAKRSMLKDDTQRYGLLKDDALIKLCTDFKIGVYTSKSCLYFPDNWVQALPACL